jgi:hypothetical protein
MTRNESAGRPRLSRIAAWHLFIEFNPQNLTLCDLFYKPDFGKSQDFPGVQAYQTINEPVHP